MRGRVALDFASSLGCDQIIADPTHIDGGVLDLVLTDVHNPIECVYSPVGTSDSNAIFIDVVLE